MRFLGLFGRGVKNASLENPETPLSAEGTWLSDLFGGDTAAGIAVSEATAMKLSTVWACVRVVAETLGSLPLNVYQRQDNGGKKLAYDHPLQRSLHDTPNEFQTSMVFREQLQAHVMTWGNAYAAIERNGAGDAVGLVPMLPDRTTRKVNQSGRGIYETQTAGGAFRLPADDVIHLPGLTFDGVTGYSVIAHHRETLALAVATREYGSRFFKNDARPGVIVSHPGRLTKQAQENLVNSVEEKTKGLGNKHSTLYLEEGVKVTEVGIPPEDAQFLQTRDFQRTEIAGIFRVPPHMVGDLARATFSNIEHQSIDFVRNTMRPWCVRWEQEFNRKLFEPGDRHFVEFNLDGLLRGDIKSRYEAYTKAIQNGVMSRNEVRRLENLEPYDGGDEMLVPLNMRGADDADQSAID